MKKIIYFIGLCVFIFTVLLAVPKVKAIDTYTFTTFDFPGATDTIPYGINNAGDIVGTYHIPGIGGQPFIYSGGVFSDLIGHPSLFENMPLDINDAGQIVGFFIDPVTTYYYGFLYDRTNYTVLEYPDALFTIAEGIDNNGNIVGLYVGSDFEANAFIYDGQYHHLDFFQDPRNSSDGHFIVGGSDSGNGLLFDGEFYREILYPGANTSYFHGINDFGKAVGAYYVGSDLHGFLYDYSDDSLYPFDFPVETSSTEAYDINNSNTVVGVYQGSDGGQHGYIAVIDPDNDGDGYNSSVDCDDDDFSTNPGAPEICDNIDNNCDGNIDEIFGDLSQVCFVGIGACEAVGIIVCSIDRSGTECDAVPGDPEIEICDGIDNDCDGEVDEGDGDNDGIDDCADTCPDEDATGFDIDSDGCIDSLSGLASIVETLVAAGVIEEVLQNSLLTKVDNALKSVDKENICSATNKLEALKNEVNAQKGKKISDEAADDIIAYTDSVISYFLSQLPAGESC